MASFRGAPIQSMPLLSVRIGGLLVIIISSGLLLGVDCDGNPPPPGPRVLEGDYNGLYRLVSDYGDPVNESVDSNYVLCLIDRTGFTLKMDPAKHTGYCFCRVHGRYSTTEGVRFLADQIEPDTAVGCSDCDESEAPVGVFVRETKGDSLILRLQEGATFKELRLLRATNSSAPRSRVI